MVLRKVGHAESRVLRHLALERSNGLGDGGKHRRLAVAVLTHQRNARGRVNVQRDALDDGNFAACARTRRGNDVQGFRLWSERAYALSACLTLRSMARSAAQQPAGRSIAAPYQPNSGWTALIRGDKEALRGKTR